MSIPRSPISICFDSTQGDSPLAITEERDSVPHLVWANGAFCQVAGLPLEELLHRPHPLIEPHGEPRSWHLKDGAERWYRQCWHSTASEDGSARRVLLLDDVTDLVTQLQLYQAVVTHHPAMVIVVNDAGAVELYNDKVEEVLGWPLADMTLGEVLQAAYPHPSDRAAMERSVGEASGTWQNFTTRAVDGRMVETCWANVHLSRGRRLGVGQDVTAQQQQWRSLSLLQQLTSAIHHLSLDAGSSFLSQTAQLLGEAFLVDLCVIRLFTEVGLCPVATFSSPEADGGCGCLMATEHPFWQVLLEHNGVMAIDDVTTSPFFQGEANSPGAITSLMAVAIRAQGKSYGMISLKFCHHPYPWQPQEQELLAAVAAQLGVVIAHRESLRYERQLGRARLDFLSLISHEIRTPMGGILTMADLVLTTALTPSQRRHLQVIRSSGQTLIDILQDILDLARLELDDLPMRCQPLALGDWLAEFLVPFQRAAQLQGLGFEVFVDGALPAQITTDHHRLGQILGNLLHNALNATTQGHILVRVEVQGSDSVLFTVADTGRGIPPTQLLALFDPLKCAYPLRSPQHSGLGLAIAMNLAQRLGGTLWALSGAAVGGTPPVGWRPPEHLLSGLPEGSVFQFTIHGSAVPCPSVTAAVTMNFPRAPLVPLRVLLAEDNDLNQKIALMMLSKLHCHAAVASDGSKALEALKHNDFDLILMDVNMPGMDGLAATRQIRALMGRTIPIVAVTASALPEDRDRCLEAGMDEVLFKPLRMEELAAVISHYQPQPTAAPSPREPMLPANLDSQALEELLAVSGGDPDFIAEVVQTFCSGTTELLDSMEQNFQRRDYVALGRDVHRLKSNSNSVGAIALGTLCRQLEELLLSSTQGAQFYRQVQQLLTALNREFPVTTQLLQRHL